MVDGRRGEEEEKEIFGLADRLVLTASTSRTAFLF